MSVEAKRTRRCAPLARYSTSTSSVPLRSFRYCRRRYLYSSQGSSRSGSAIGRLPRHAVLRHQDRIDRGVVVGDQRGNEGSVGLGGRRLFTPLAFAARAAGRLVSAERRRLLAATERR